MRFRINPNITKLKLMEYGWNSVFIRDLLRHKGRVVTLHEYKSYHDSSDNELKHNFNLYSESDIQWKQYNQGSWSGRGVKDHMFTMVFTKPDHLPEELFTL